MFDTQESTGPDKQANLRLVRLTYGFACVVAAAGLGVEIYRHGLARPFSVGTGSVVLVLNSVWLVSAKATPWKSLNVKLLMSMILLWLPRWIHDIFFP